MRRRNPGFRSGLSANCCGGAIPAFGLPAVLRCLAALWRLPDEDVFLASHGPAAVAAGIERMVCQRANRQPAASLTSLPPTASRNPQWAPPTPT